MAFTEMSFLAGVKTDKYINSYNSDVDDDILASVRPETKDNVYGSGTTEQQATNWASGHNPKSADDKDVIDKNPDEETTYTIIVSPEKNRSIKQKTSDNHIQSTISKNYEPTKNPYIKLLENFGENSGQKRLKSSDFMYLRDIGVHPINKMMILRRFGGAPGYDLNPSSLNKDDNKKIHNPISTVIGWVKPDDNLFNFSFNEVWKTDNKFLHELIREIINDQFGVDIANIFPIPGWGQGFIFGMLNDMGMTNYNAKNLPLGDANLLREGVTRESAGQGLISSFSFTLETCYELKYINGVDPTVVFHNIINNLLEMGTSNMNFLFKGGSSVSALMKFVDSPDVGGLVKVMETFIKRVVDGLKKTINKFAAPIKSALKGENIKALKEGTVESENDKKYENEKQVAKLTPLTGEDSKKAQIYNSVVYGKPLKASNYDIKIAGENIKKREENSNLVGFVQSAKDKNEKSKGLLGSLDKLKLGEQMSNLILSSVNTVLASTIGRYKWPIRGSINQSTGMVVTPWHLTIGNPYSPVISMNNIKVDNVDISFGKEMMFNDLPKYIHVTIKISQARNMGKQEMARMFGVTYKRDYSGYGVKNGDITKKEQTINDKFVQNSLVVKSAVNTKVTEPVTWSPFSK